jgi:hypothetical protein
MRKFVYFIIPVLVILVVITVSNRKPEIEPEVQEPEYTIIENPEIIQPPDYIYTLEKLSPQLSISGVKVNDYISRGVSITDLKTVVYRGFVNVQGASIYSEYGLENTSFVYGDYKPQVKTYSDNGVYNIIYLPE